MSLYDYRASKELSESDPPFAALIMAALRKADSANAYELRSAFPDICAEMQARYDAPGGVLPSDAVIGTGEDDERYTMLTREEELIAAGRLGDRA